MFSSEDSGKRSVEYNEISGDQMPLNETNVQLTAYICKKIKQYKSDCLEKKNIRKSPTSERVSKNNALPSTSNNVSNHANKTVLNPRNRAASPELNRTAPAVLTAKRLTARRQTVCIDRQPNNNAISLRFNLPYSNEIQRDAAPNQASAAETQPTLNRIQKIQPNRMPAHPINVNGNSSSSVIRQQPQYLTSIPKDVYNQACAKGNSSTTNHGLKVLSLDELNSRADQMSRNTNIIQRPGSANGVSIESNNNINFNSNTNGNAILNRLKSVRVKFSPIRPELQRVQQTPTPTPPSPPLTPPQLQQQQQQQQQSSTAQQRNDIISVALSKLNDNQLELSLTQYERRIQYEELTEQQLCEVKRCLLDNDIWLQMIEHLKKGRPTSETLTLLHRLLPPAQQTHFLNELRNHPFVRSIC